MFKIVKGPDVTSLLAKSLLFTTSTGKILQIRVISCLPTLNQGSFTITGQGGPSMHNAFFKIVYRPSNQEGGAEIITEEEATEAAA